MKDTTKELILNYLMLLGVLLIFLSGIILTISYWNSKKSECIKDPFAFGAKQLEEKYGVDVSGSIVMFNKNSEKFYRNVLMFDSNSTYLE